LNRFENGRILEAIGETESRTGDSPPRGSPVAGLELASGCGDGPPALGTLYAALPHLGPIRERAVGPGAERTRLNVTPEMVDSDGGSKRPVNLRAGRGHSTGRGGAAQTPPRIFALTATGPRVSKLAAFFLYCSERLARSRRPSSGFAFLREEELAGDFGPLLVAHRAG